MEGGRRIVQTAIDTFGGIDGVVCIAGILRERMLFNMSEDEWDPVIETHLKGTFTVFRAAAPVFRAQKSGTLIGFTSGAFAGSVAQANYSAAKGGIVSLVRSAALGMYKYGVTANVIAPVAKSRMSGNVPFGIEMGEPEDVAPMVVFLLGDAAREVTGQVYTANGGHIAVWNQPAEVRSIDKQGRWTPEEIAEHFAEARPGADADDGPPRRDEDRGGERREAERLGGSSAFSAGRGGGAATSLPLSALRAGPLGPRLAAAHDACAVARRRPLLRTVLVPGGRANSPRRSVGAAPWAWPWYAPGSGVRTRASMVFRGTPSGARVGPSSRARPMGRCVRILRAIDSGLHRNCRSGLVDQDRLLANENEQVANCFAVVRDGECELPGLCFAVGETFFRVPHLPDDHVIDVDMDLDRVASNAAAALAAQHRNTAIRLQIQARFGGIDNRSTASRQHKGDKAHVAADRQMMASGGFDLGRGRSADVLGWRPALQHPRYDACLGLVQAAPLGLTDPDP